MSVCCRVLNLCQKSCDCKPKQGLADVIQPPALDPVGLVREVPQLRDDCGCVAAGELSSPNHGGVNVNRANDWVALVDLADDTLGFLDEDGR